MEATVDKLESMFQKADADLDYLSRKLDAEFHNDPETNDLSRNPRKVLERVAEIKKEYAEVVKEAHEIKRAQEEAMTFFRTELTTLCTTLAKLQQNVGTEAAPPPAELQQVNDALGLLLPSVKPDLAQTEATGGSASSQVTPQDVTPPAPASKQKKDSEDSEDATSPTPVSPFELRASSQEFIEITKEEFQTVSELVRGRVKLSDVNQVYGILWAHFKESSNTDPLTSQDMHKMSLRVTGHTGEAKLKVLRSLKLLSISNKGQVKLL